jgi:hypothetical protein
MRPHRYETVSVPLRLIHGDSGGVCLALSSAFAPDHIGKKIAPCLEKLFERRGEAASIDHYAKLTQSLQQSESQHGDPNRARVVSKYQ